MIARGYTSHFYCDDKRECSHLHPHLCSFDEFFGRTWSETLRMAKRDGWSVSKDLNRATCPLCNKVKS